MEHRFVGWHWSHGQDAPFVDHDVFGLSGTTFGVGLLVCTPDGEDATFWEVGSGLSNRRQNRVQPPGVRPVRLRPGRR